MPLTRWILSTRDTIGSPIRDAIVNTLYFNVSGSVDDPDYESIGEDLQQVWESCSWWAGRYFDFRAYDMDDAKPREPKWTKMGTLAGTKNDGVHQVALCLSYHTGRNLPSQRGRIYCGPFASSQSYASNAQCQSVTALAGYFAGIGGLNVDWSLYSPKNNTHNAIKHAWCDNSWDIIRSRKLASTYKSEVDLNG